jgi:hypothetical protein
MDTTNSYEQAEANPNLEPCSICGKSIAKGIEKCPHCGAPTGHVASKKNYAVIGGSTFLIIGIVIFLLSFHIALEYGKIFPKEKLTFDNTFITRAYVDNFVERYNNANFLEKLELRQGSLMNKLIEQDILYMKDEENSNENNFYDWSQWFQ